MKWGYIACQMPKVTTMAEQHQEATHSLNSSKAQEKEEDHSSAARTRKTYVTKKMREKTKTTTPSPSTQTTVESLINTTKEIVQNIAESTTDLVEAVTSQVVSSASDIAATITPDNVENTKGVATPVEATIFNEKSGKTPRTNNTEQKNRLFIFSITLMVMGFIVLIYDSLYTTIATITMWIYYILYSTFVEYPRSIYRFVTQDFASVLKQPNTNVPIVEQMGPPAIPHSASQRGLRGMVRPYVLHDSQYDDFDLYRN